MRSKEFSVQGSQVGTQKAPLPNASAFATPYMASIFTRMVILAVGYIYPAYECFKSIEVSKRDVDRLQMWCQYWIIIAILTVIERLADVFVSWLPLYSEVKVAFLVYLWHPKTKGAMYVYSTFLKPLVSKHEMDIDRNLMFLRRQALQMSVVYWKKILVYGQAVFFEFLHYLSSQSPHASPQPGLATLELYPSVYLAQVPPGYQLPPPQPAWGCPGYEPQIPQHAHRVQPVSSELWCMQPSASVVSCDSKTYEEDEDSEFEWVDADEVPVPALDTANKAVGIPAQGTLHFRRWWQSCCF